MELGMATVSGLYFFLPHVLRKTDHIAREETHTHRDHSFLVFLVFKCLFKNNSDDLYTSPYLRVTFTPRR